MVDPDLQIRKGGGHPEPEIKGVGGGGGRPPYKLFSALWASFSSKNKGGGPGPPQDPPLDLSLLFTMVLL